MATRTFDQLIASRAGYKGRLTTFKNWLASADPKTTNARFVDLKLQRLECTFTGYDEVQTLIENQSDDQFVDRTEFEENYEKVLVDAQNLILKIKLSEQPEPSLLESPIAFPSPSSGDNYNAASPRLILPQITLPKFSGKHEEWYSFYEVFVSLIGSNDKIPLVQKHHYLRAYLDGPAAHLLESVPVTAENYATSISLLQSKYEQPKLALKTHMNALFNLEQVRNENARALENLLVSASRHVRSLEARGQQVQHWNLFLVQLLVSKLDPITSRAWELETADELNPSFKQLCTFLQQRVNVLSSINKSLIKRPSINKQRTTLVHKALATTSELENKPKQSSCELCQERHPLYFCTKFKKMSVDDRRKHAQKMKRCFNCLSKSHSFSNCPSTRRCNHCKGKHHSILHRPSYQNSVEDEPAASSLMPQSEHTNEDLAQSCLHNSTSHRGYHVLLSTSLVEVKDKNGDWKKARCLLDSAATHDFVTSKLVETLNIPTTKTDVKVTGIDRKDTEALQFAKLSIRDSIHGKFSMNLNCLVIKHIGSEIPSATFATKGWSIPSNLKLADPTFNIKNEVDILLSAETFWRIFLGGKVKVAPGVFIRNTKLGWIMTGKMHFPTQHNQSQCHFTDVNLQEQIEKFWKLEVDSDDSKTISSEDSYCEDLYKRTTSRNSNGRFIVKMPRISERVLVQNTKQKALKLFHSTENRLAKDNKLQLLYSNFMEEYEALDHMENVSSKEEFMNDPVYLSHHPVWKDKASKENIRVVFNGSSVDRDGKSLNDYLLCGPALQRNLFDVLINFRLHDVAVIADIEKMYRQILIHPEDQDLQRIFWRSSSNQPIKIFRLKTLTYGLKPSSFLAIRTLHELANKDGDLYCSSSATALKENFYVDDYIQSFRSEDEAKQVVSDLNSLLQGGGFNLTKFCSNSSQLLGVIPESKRALNPPDLFSEETIVKTLGLHWKPSVDIFTYQYKGEMIKKPTKRNILSKIASIFDPIHFIAPVVVQAKILMQQLWQFKCEWDDVVPSEFLNSWTKFENGLSDLPNIIIPRQVCGTTKIYSPDLHLFCDASEKAYGCTAYLVNNNSNKISSSLVCSKSKVAPLKKTTLPRLELCSAVLATELKIKLTSILQVSINNVFFWTDSMIVLAWLAQPANSWQTFVANRVQFIHNHSELNQWSYVPSKQNPADIVSRGCSPSQLIDNNLYWQGPYWLTQTTLHWPSKVTNEITTKVPEKKKKEFVLTVIDQSKKFYEKYSNFNRLVRVVAYIRRWKTKVLEKNVHLPDYLTSKEIQDATVNVIRLAQQCFSTEIKHLTSGQSVLKCSALHSLNPFIDEKGLLRVNGRLNLGNFPQDKKQPIILPYRNHITNILIEKFHRKHLHVGPQSLLYYIREEYWPINGLKSVTAIVRKCIPCHKVNPKPATQLMGNLPKSRLSPQRPFNVTGIDYAGPIYLKNFTGKAYIAIFVCMLIGAVHLELVSSGNTPHFLAALERFVSRRGKPIEIYSDNGANFLKAWKILKRGQEREQKEVMNNFCAENNIVWHFNPPYAPFMGGRWEAQIKILKKHLKATIGDIILPYEHLNSLLIQIEAIMNSRPISPLSSDPSDIMPLTPSHFLIGQSLTSLPSSQERQKEFDLIVNLKLIKERENHFWNRWKKEYLNHLQQRHKWFSSIPNVKIGDLVMIKQPSPVLVWKLGRVVRLFMGRDKKCRVVEVLTSKGVYTRPISWISPLPISYHEYPHEQEKC